ncbi:MAG: hypothetical protein AAGA48_35695, partial [Myxococcota bacterium]
MFRLFHFVGAAIWLLAAPATFAQSATPDLTGTRVALVSAATDSAFPEDIRDTIMVGSRGVGGVYQILELPGGVFVPNPLPYRPGYEIVGVDLFDAAVDVPTADELADYDALLVYNNTTFVDADVVGDLAAAMSERGKAVILTGAAMDSTIGIRGRFTTQSLSPVGTGPQVSPGGDLGIVPVDPVDTWTTNLDDGMLTGPNVGSLADWGTQALGANPVRVRGGPSSQHVEGLILRDFAYAVHEWSNGELADAFLPPVVDGQGAIAVANWNPVSDGADPTGWTRQTQGGRLLANVILQAVVLSADPVTGDTYQRPQGFCSVPDAATEQPVPFRTQGLLGPVPQGLHTTCDLVSLVGADPASPFGTLVRCADDSYCVDVTGDPDATCSIRQNRSIERDLNCNGLDTSLET